MKMINKQWLPFGSIKIYRPLYEYKCLIYALSWCAHSQMSLRDNKDFETSRLNFNPVFSGSCQWQTNFEIYHLSLKSFSENKISQSRSMHK